MKLKRTLLSALAAVLLAEGAASAAGRAILWVPVRDAGIGEILDILEKGKDLRLTAAFPEPPKGFEARVKKLAKEGRLELAARPEGDPPLPLIYSPDRPEVKWNGKPASVPEPQNAAYFLPLRLSMARDAAVREDGAPPAGLVSPPGGLSPDYFPLARSLGMKWIACGPLISTAAAMEADGVYAVPFVKFSTSVPDYEAPSFMLFDETSAGDPAALRAQLAAELRAPSAYRLSTVSGALEGVVAESTAAAAVSAAASPWSGDYTPWAAARLQAGALAALAQTRGDLMLYLNSLQGDYRRAEPAFRQYFAAEEGDNLAVLASSASASDADLELRNTLANAYRLMGKPPPPWAFTTLADAASGGDQEDRVSVSTVPGGFELTNSGRSPQLPDSTPGLPAGADPSRIWKLQAIQVSTSDAGILFRFEPGAIDNTPGGPYGFSHITLDLYIDINHRVNAGITRPLDGRPLRIFPNDAWEYALEVSTGGASFYQITPDGPKRTAVLAPSVQDGWISVLVPASYIRGTPELWSYAALLLYPKDGGYAIADYIADQIADGYIYAFRPEPKSEAPLLQDGIF